MPLQSPRAFSGATLLLLGFGSVGRGLLPLLRRHLDLSASRVVVVSADSEGESDAVEAGCAFVQHSLAAADHEGFLSSWLRSGDLLLNLSVDVSSAALLEWCRRHAVDYVDSYIEPWRHSPALLGQPGAAQTNHALRQQVLPLREAAWRSTALIMHGANPGLSFHFMRQALLELAERHGVPPSAENRAPASAHDWARLARALEVRVIHVSERDSQVDGIARQPGEFVNTWSTSGFLVECSKPVEVGWGTHERVVPNGACTHECGHGSTLYFKQPGGSRFVRSWTPRAGAGDAFLIGLSDAVTMSEYLSVFEAPGALSYRPTVCYAYRPCDATTESLRELAANGWLAPLRQRLLKETLVGGADELGVLLLSPKYGGYWYGSRLTLEAARSLAPCNSATTLQVAAGVLAGLMWVLEHPHSGLREPGDLPHDSLLRWALPYLGQVGGVECNWMPSTDSGDLAYQFAQFSPG